MSMIRWSRSSRVVSRKKQAEFVDYVFPIDYELSLSYRPEEVGFLADQDCGLSIHLDSPRRLSS
jgi:hypothetical protein